MLLSNVGESSWYIRWNKASAPTCLLYASSCMAFLLREPSGITIILTARLWIASSVPSDVLESAIHTDETMFINVSERVGGFCIFQP